MLIMIQRERTRFLLVYAAIGFGSLALYCLLFWSLDMSPLPSANNARRLMLSMDKSLPIIAGIKFSLDPWKLAVLFFPLPLGAGLMVLLGNRAHKIIAAASLGAFLAGVLFFSFYFYTTWQGRYLVPFLFLLIPAALGGYGMLLKDQQPLRELLFTLVACGYFAASSYILLQPLANYSKVHKTGRNAGTSNGTEFYQQASASTKVLCLEVQGAAFHPELTFISSEGLITPEALAARREGLTVLEFIKQQQPDLVSILNCPLDDPDGIQNKLRKAVAAKEDVVVGDLDLVYQGWMRGTGPVWKVVTK